MQEQSGHRGHQLQPSPHHPHHAGELDPDQELREGCGQDPAHGSDPPPSHAQRRGHLGSPGAEGGGRQGQAAAAAGQGGQHGPTQAARTTPSGNWIILIIFSMVHIKEPKFRKKFLGNEVGINMDQNEPLSKIIKVFRRKVVLFFIFGVYFIPKSSVENG